MYIQKRTLRFGSVFLFLIGCLVIFSIHLVLIQFFRASHLAALAEKQHNHYIEIEPVRGTIYDRRMRPIALNIPAYSLYANPRRMKTEEKQRAVKELPAIIGLPAEDIRERLDKDKLFVWLTRKLPMDSVEEVRALKIHGLDFIKESKRHYPNGYLGAHLIGFAGMDNEGLEGLELLYNEYLKGSPGYTNILRDARHHELLMEKSFYAPKDGFDLVLTIDETIQYIVEEALQKAYEKHNAQSASVVVMDPRTGEILALANRNTYNLSDFSNSTTESRTNRAIAHVYEPGSVFKIVALTAALEENLFRETDKIFCENGEYKVGNHILHDHHPHGTLTFSGVIQESSNIGTTKIAQKMGKETFYKYAKRFGFGQMTGIDLLGEVPGVLKDPSLWSKTSIGAVPIGHEVLVTPLQLVRAMAAIANDGVMMKPFVVKYIKDRKDQLIHSYQEQPVDRIMSVETAKRAQAILTKVVEDGTGKMARIDGMAIAGKTGTSQKVINGQYSHDKFYASFIGFAPADDPRIAVAIVFDDPHPSHFGGTVAAPVFKEIAINTIKYLNAIEFDQKPIIPEYANR